VIFGANVLGAMLFAFTVVYGEVLPPPALQVLFGEVAGKLDHGFWNTILKAGVGGWLVRLWPGWPSPSEIRSSRRLQSTCWPSLYRPAVQFYCVAGSSEVLIGVFAGEVSSLEYLRGSLLPATLGNTIGGVFPVAVLDYGQVAGSSKKTSLAGYAEEDE